MGKSVLAPSLETLYRVFVLQMLSHQTQYLCIILRECRQLLGASPLDPQLWTPLEDFRPLDPSLPTLGKNPADTLQMTTVKWSKVKVTWKMPIIRQNIRRRRKPPWTVQVQAVSRRRKV